MTKQELIERLSNIPNDVVVCLVSPDGSVNDIDIVMRSQSYPPDWIKQDEVLLHSTKGRTGCQ